MTFILEKLVRTMSAWGKKSTAIPASNLADIMSEQLIKKIETIDQNKEIGQFLKIGNH